MMDFRYRFGDGILSEKKTTKKKKKNKYTKKVELMLKILGIFMCVMQLVAGIIGVLYLVKLDMFPTKYIITFGIVYLVITIIFFVLQKWTTAGIVTKFMSLVVMGVTIVGCMYLDYTYKEVQEMMGIDTKVDNVHVYVLKDDPAQDLTDAADYTFGILTVQDRENTDATIVHINEDVGKEIATVEYDSVTTLMQALYDQEVGCIILNSAYISFVAEDENYKDFADKVRSIAAKDFETVVEPEVIPEEYLYSGDKVFTIYISGVDTRGTLNENSNTDANILVTVNMDTRQILMISTPRDYYIPLSISNGVCDKLTHSGIYGIDVSKETLEMLYGVHIDDYVRINFVGCKDIVDELGGITVYVDSKFVWEKYVFPAGENNLDGEWALAFARCRNFPEGDRRRVKNQMKVVEAVIDKMLSKEMLTNYTDVLDAVSDSVITSMGYDEIAELVKFQLDDMREWEILKYSVEGYDSTQFTYSVPNLATYAMIPNEESVERAKEYLRQMYAGEKITLEQE